MLVKEKRIDATGTNSRSVATVPNLVELAWSRRWLLPEYVADDAVK